MASRIARARLGLELVGVSLALALVGCGSSTPGPREVIQDWISAVKSGNAVKVCSHMTPQLQARVVRGGSCVTVFHLFAVALARQVPEFQIGNATIHGSTATVSAATPRTRLIYTLQKTGGRWLISDYVKASSSS